MYDSVQSVCGDADRVEISNRRITCYRGVATVPFNPTHEVMQMNNIIYIVGLIVVVLVILSFFGLR